MDLRYPSSANMPQHYDYISSITKHKSNNNLSENTKRSTPVSSRYFHRAPLLFPRYNQQHLRSSPLRFSSSYLGPLHYHRPRFLSAWDLTPRPTIYSSSRNVATTTPTFTSMSKQHDHGSCLSNNHVSL